ncbi:MAG: AbrB/MazE/SpoVT family DNA-binding domain-containing protein [Armatimonadetes bacterium]|nr:AbrB/MazE/SpoVT family DNA-binding domain-containing protein [Armatimonadota bacterium]
MTTTTKVGKRGTLVIPAALRRQYHLAEGSLVIAEARDDGILLRPARAVPRDQEEAYEQLIEASNAAYAALRADPAAWAEVEAERAVWDGTLMDGLDPDEYWTEDREVHYVSAAPR